MSQTAPPSKIHEATRIPGGVLRGAELSQAEAEARRAAGEDVVVRGDDTRAACLLARAIETAVGPCYHDGPHAAAGLHALPHWQQRYPPPAGHCFYETATTKCVGGTP